MVKGQQSAGCPQTMAMDWDQGDKDSGWLGGHCEIKPWLEWLDSSSGHKGSLTPSQAATTIPLPSPVQGGTWLGVRPL